MYCSEFYEYLWHQIFAWSLLKGNIFGVQQKHSYKLYGFCRTTLSCFWCTSISVCDTDLISDHYSPIWNSWWVNMWWSVVSHLSCHTSLALWQELYQLSWLLSEIFRLHVPLNFTSSRHFEWLKDRKSKMINMTFPFFPQVLSLYSCGIHEQSHAHNNFRFHGFRYIWRNYFQT